MVNLLDITAKCKKAGRAGVRQEPKAYGCPDTAEHEEDADEEDDSEEDDYEENLHPLIEDEIEEDDLPDPESHRVDHNLYAVDQVQLDSLYYLGTDLFFPDATGQVGGHRCHSPLPDQVLP